jgi:hypothetical protein
VDVEAALVAALGAAGFRVYAGDLPPHFEQSLPVVRVTALPAKESARAWNGPALLDQADVDVDVFAGDVESTADVSRAVRAALQDMTIPRAALLAAPVFTRRPAWNERTHRRGAVLSLATR